MADDPTTAVRAARAGNMAAWDELFRSYQLPLYAYVFELVRQEQAALDIVQETFIGAARHLASLAEDGKFGSWLFGIAHQKCVQQWRRRQRDARLWDDREQLPELASTPGDDPAEELVRREDEAAFLDCLAQLPEAQRSILLLHYLEEFSLEEIAQIVGTAVGTVKSRLHYARRSLRERLRQRPSPI